MFGATSNGEMLSCVHIVGNCPYSMLCQVKLNSFEEGVVFQGYGVDFMCDRGSVRRRYS